MTAPDVMLPGNSGTFERVLLDTLLEVLPVPFRELVDPDRTPVPFLPFLAQHESVDLWFDDWPLLRRRLMVKLAPYLATLKGTPAATPAFLAFVDAVILDKITHPERFVMGRAVLGRTPIGHKAFTARHLVKVRTFNPPGVFVMGRSALGRAVLRTPSRETLNRALTAMKIAKSDDTQYRADFSHKRPLRLSDAVPLARALPLGAYLDRTRL